jgi:hypothetical protein
MRTIQAFNDSDDSFVSGTGDHSAVNSPHQTAVEIEPQRLAGRVTRPARHDRRALIRKRGKSVGTQVPHTPNANDQIGDRNKNIGAGAGQAGRSRALT